jgi:hypothetical protein
VQPAQYRFQVVPEHPVAIGASELSKPSEIIEAHAAHIASKYRLLPDAGIISPASRSETPQQAAQAQLGTEREFPLFFSALAAKVHFDLVAVDYLRIMHIGFSHVTLLAYHMPHSP